MDTSTVSGNMGGTGAGVANVGGRASITASTISENLARGFGGGVYNSESGLVLENSTISKNTSGSDGGAIYNAPGTKLRLSHSTISRNQAKMYGGIFGACGGCYNIFSNTIIAGNSAQSFPDFKGWLNFSEHNLYGDITGAVHFSETDLFNVDPMLGTLTDNGGPTRTMALRPGSPAIDAGDNTGAPQWDQRGEGFPRIVNGTIDIGAFELQATRAPTAPDLLALLITMNFERDD